MDVTVSQQAIKNWFDDIYRKRKFSYLRPQSAYEIFTTLLEVESGKKHLDVACGLGLMMKSMTNRKVSSYGIDLSTEAIKEAKKYCPEGEVREGNAEVLPYDDHQFDYLTCLGSLERMIDREAVLSEQYRVSKIGAKLCFMVRNSEHFIWKFILKPFGLDNKEGHQDAMNLEQWTSLFKQCGFKIRRVVPDHWPFYRLLLTFWPFGVDTSRERKFLHPLTWSYEFIFILEKTNDG